MSNAPQWVAGRSLDWLVSVDGHVVEPPGGGSTGAQRLFRFTPAEPSTRD